VEAQEVLGQQADGEHAAEAAVGLVAGDADVEERLAGGSRHQRFGHIDAAAALQVPLEVVAVEGLHGRRRIEAAGDARPAVGPEHEDVLQLGLVRAQRAQERVDGQLVAREPLGRPLGDVADTCEQRLGRVHHLERVFGRDAQHTVEPQVGFGAQLLIAEHAHDHVGQQRQQHRQPRQPGQHAQPRRRPRPARRTWGGLGEVGQGTARRKLTHCDAAGPPDSMQRTVAGGTRLAARRVALALDRVRGIRARRGIARLPAEHLLQRARCALARMAGRAGAVRCFRFTHGGGA